MEGFSKNAGDLFKVAVLLAGFDRAELLAEVHRRAPSRATVSTLEQAMMAIRRRHAAGGRT